MFDLKQQSTLVLTIVNEDYSLNAHKTKHQVSKNARGLVRRKTNVHTGICLWFHENITMMAADME
jgi:hypothetical protein